MYPQNNLVVQTARDASKDFDYNDALYDMLGDISTAHSLPDRLGAFKSAFPGLTQDQIPYIYSPFYAPLKTSAILSRGTGNPTFTRATTAYVKDFEGLYKAVLSGEIRFTGARRVHNITPNSIENSTITGWSVDGATITTGQPDPFGGNNAWLITRTGASGNWAHFFNTQTYNMVGRNFRVSAWMKKGTQLTGLSLGCSDLSGHTSTVTVTSVLTDRNWHRVSILSDNGFTNPNNSSSGLVFTVNGDSVYIFMEQCEDVTGQTNQNPSEHVSVGVLAAPYYGAGVAGVQYFPYQNGNTVASNVVTEGQGAAIADATLQGYLSESAATQLVTPTASIRDMTNASWIAVTCTKAKNATGIDGVANAASSLTATGVNATVLQTLVAAASSRTNSAFVRRKTGTGTILLKQGTATLDITALINSTTYTLVQLNDNELNVAFGFQINTSGDAIEVDFNQFEAGDIATSPMATAGATRNADALTYPDTGNVSSTVGTCYAETYINKMHVSGFYPGLVTLNSATEISALRLSPTTATIHDGTTGASVSVAPAGGQHKYCSSWGGTKIIIAADGTLGTGATFDGSMNVNEIRIGALYTAGYETNGNIRNVRIWGVQLSDAILQGLTT